MSDAHNRVYRIRDYVLVYGISSYIATFDICHSLLPSAVNHLAPLRMQPSAKLLVPRIHRAIRTRPLACQSRASPIFACPPLSSLSRIERLSLDHSALHTTRAARNAVPRPLTHKSHCTHCSSLRIPPPQPALRPLSTTSAAAAQLDPRRNQHARQRARSAHLNAATRRNGSSVILSPCSRVCVRAALHLTSHRQLPTHWSAVHSHFTPPHTHNTLTLNENGATRVPSPLFSATSTPTSHARGSRAVSLGDGMGSTDRRMRGWAAVAARGRACNSPACTIRPQHLVSVVLLSPLLCASHCSPARRSKPRPTPPHFARRVSLHAAPHTAVL